MKPTVEVNELMERIRHAANQENGLTDRPARRAPSSSDLPPVAEPFPPPPSPTRNVDGPGDPTRPESLLEQAASMLRGGRSKTTVSKRVPGWLRPIFRNQGGYNSVLLEAAERLVEVNRALRQQNYDLHERMMNFHAWALSVAEISAENCDRTLAADARLQSFSEERWSQIAERIDRLEKGNGRGEDTALESDGSVEERLARLTAHVEAMEAGRHELNDQLSRLRAQLDEQAQYTRTVHHHLDQLGAHVAGTLDRLDRPV